MVVGNVTTAGKLSLSGGTMIGNIIIPASTDYTTGKVRNIILSTSDPTSGDGVNGDIWIKYTA